MEKLQSDRDTQISAFCIVFFVIAFPVYFGMASSLTDLGELPGPKGDYEATVVESNLTLGESELNLDDGEPQTISFDTNTIAADLEGSYIAYVRFTISWAETNEQGQGQDQCDEVALEIDMTGVAHNVSNITTEQYDESGNCADGVEHMLEFEMIQNAGSNGIFDETRSSEEDVEYWRKKRLILFSLLSETMCPSAMNTGIICTLYHYRSEDYSRMIVYQYIMSVFTMSLLMSLFLSTLQPTD